MLLCCSQQSGSMAAVAYTVEQRTGEIGVRMALGAQTRDVLRLIVNQGMRPVVIGLAIGIVSAFAIGRLLTSQLYEVSAHNPALLAASTVLLAAIALIACLVPARRAAHVRSDSGAARASDCLKLFLNPNWTLAAISFPKMFFGEQLSWPFALNIRDAAVSHIELKKIDMSLRFLIPFVSAAFFRLATVRTGQKPADRG